MKTVAMLNGQFVDINQPHIYIEDRGHQFGDGVYEVIPVMKGRLIGFEMHMERLDRSLREMKIPAVYTWEEYYDMFVDIMKEGQIFDGNIYMQVTRGHGPRQHAFPDPTVPNITMVGRSVDLAKAEKQRAEGIAVASMPDIRWGRCDIKSINLLANILCKQKASDQGAYEAILLADNGEITEGAQSSFFAIKDGVLWVHPNDNSVLPGCTKRIIFEYICPKLGMPIVEKAFTLDFAKGADEALCTASGICAMPVVKIDRQPVGNGKPGEWSKKIQNLFDEFVLTQKVVLEK